MAKSIGVAVLLALAAGLGRAPATRAGMITVTQYDGDATSGISSAKTYTHAVDLAGSGETINGVQFVAGGAGLQTQYHYDLEGVNQVGTSTRDNVNGSIRNLESRYYYDSVGREQTLTLTDLTVGYIYTTTFYDLGNGQAGQRDVTITDGDRTRFVYDANNYGDGNGSLIRDTFVATSTTYRYTYDYAPGASFDQYGFTNEVVAPEPSSLALLGVGAVCLLGRAWRKRQQAAAAA